MKTEIEKRERDKALKEKERVGERDKREGD